MLHALSVCIEQDPFHRAQQAPSGAEVGVAVAFEVLVGAIVAVALAEGVGVLV